MGGYRLFGFTSSTAIERIRDISRGSSSTLTVGAQRQPTFEWILAFRVIAREVTVFSRLYLHFSWVALVVFLRCEGLTTPQLVLVSGFGL